MEQISWQEMVALSCSETEGVFGQGAREVRQAKEMIRSAYRAAVPYGEVQHELSEVMRRRGMSTEHTQRQIARLHAAWSWAEPLEDQAVDELMDAVDNGIASLIDDLEGLGVSALIAEEVRLRLVDIRRMARHARFINGARMDASESSLEIDPETGREVYVAKIEPKSE